MVTVLRIAPDDPVNQGRMLSSFYGGVLIGASFAYGLCRDSINDGASSEVGEELEFAGPKSPPT